MSIWPRGWGIGGRVTPVIGGAAIADEVVARVESLVLRGCEQIDQSLEEVLYETVYREQTRIAQEPPDPRAAHDEAFLKRLRHEIAVSRDGGGGALLRLVLTRYVDEISGYFDARVYRLATGVVPPALGALLHGGKPGPSLFDVDDRVRLEGDVDGLVRAAQLGTVVLVPTHFSNLDALVLGYAIFRLGLPPFAYGAGLNLFSNPLTGFFMRNLGAFTVDRKKTDPLYRAAVKEYATVLLERGQHLLFFPGGTRSRSGALASRLKLGFLSGVIKAFRTRKARSRDSAPIFVVPCSLSYPLVLEAATLVDNYLTTEGGPHFIDVQADESERPASWLSFLSGLAELDMRVHVRFGAPLDPLGNAIDASGVSRDGAGRALDPARYFLVDGEVAADDARDREYTKLLAKSVVSSHRKESVALPSSVLAYALFACLSRRYPKLELFRLLRAIGPRAAVPLSVLEPQIDLVLEGLRAAALRREIVLSPELMVSGKRSVLERGLAALTTYHREPVLLRSADTIEITQPALLLYYQNRLQGFGLPGAQIPRSHREVTWSQLP